VEETGLGCELSPFSEVLFQNVANPLGIRLNAASAHSLFGRSLKPDFYYVYGSLELALRSETWKSLELCGSCLQASRRRKRTRARSGQQEPSGDAPNPTPLVVAGSEFRLPARRVDQRRAERCPPMLVARGLSNLPKGVDG